MNVSDIITEFGNYYRQQGQGVASLFQVVNQPFESENALTPMFTDQTIWQASKASFNKVLQPFQRAFTPTQTSKFTPLEIRMFHMKGDVLEYPDDLESSWLGFLSSAKLKRSEWPIIRWMLENQFYPQLKEDLELDAVGRGVFVSPTINVASEPIKAMNGLQKIINDQITAGRMTPIGMGAIPSSDQDFVDYIEEFADMMDKKYWSQPMDVNLSQTLARKYARGYRDKYDKSIDFDVNKSINVQLTNLTLKPLPSMNLKNDGEPCNRIFCTPKKNKVILKKKTQNMDMVDIQDFNRDVKIMTDFWLGVGFILPEIVFCNDQA
ncbi:hypothetical protein [Tellurirhabdus bombi]|uniref:hypothetical protein n=1 Tax=Tellurirhabdus bombi TaxID=2907205 RepID=UPI001F3CD721|nr:hypothetical protein [Tellurirhabdus bombi]